MYVLGTIFTPHYLLQCVFVPLDPCKKIRKLWNEQQNGVNVMESPNFSLRVDSGPLAGRFSTLAAENGYIQLMASSVLLALKGSTLGSFGMIRQN